MKETSKRLERTSARAKDAERTPTSGDTAASPRPLGLKEQSELFEKAIQLFHRRNFSQALELFEAAAGGPAMEMAHSARTHARICRQRIESATPSLVSADDHYHYAIALLNERKIKPAEEHLLTAARLAPNQDYIHYALAVCYALQSDVQHAYANLKRAIELHPRNRSQARSDPDFAEVVRQPMFSQLLSPEAGSSA